MTNTSLSKQLARLTRPLRAGLGWADVATTPDAGPPFRRTTRKGAPGGRLAALEIDIDRLTAGWNQHLPQILAAVADARNSSRAALLSRKDLSKLDTRLMALEASVADMSRRLDQMSSDKAAEAEAARPAAPTTRQQGSGKA